MSEKLYKFIDLCISNFNYGGRLPTKELEHEYFDLKKEIGCALKLQELVEERIKPLNVELDIIANTANGVKSCGSDYHLKILNERNYYQTLIVTSKE